MYRCSISLIHHYKNIMELDMMDLLTIETRTVRQHYFDCIRHRYRSNKMDNNDK